MVYDVRTIFKKQSEVLMPDKSYYYQRKAFQETQSYIYAETQFPIELLTV